MERERGREGERERKMGRKGVKREVWRGIVNKRLIERE